MPRSASRPGMASEKVLPHEIEERIAHHRGEDGARLPIFEPFCLFRCHYEMKVSSFSTKIRLPKQKTAPGAKKVANFPPTDGSVSGSPRYSPDRTDGRATPPSTRSGTPCRSPSSGSACRGIRAKASRNRARDTPICSGSQGAPTSRSRRCTSPNGMICRRIRSRSSGHACRSRVSCSYSPCRSTYLPYVSFQTAGHQARDRRRRRPGCPARSPPPRLPCGHAARDVEPFDGRLEQHLKKGRRGERADSDLETVRNRLSSEAQVLHVPQMAELMLGPGGRTARLRGLHGETAQQKPFGQPADLPDVARMHARRIAQRLRQSVLHEREGEIVHRLGSHGVGQHPVGPGGNLGDQISIPRGGERGGGPRRRSPGRKPCPAAPGSRTSACCRPG